MIKLKQRSSDEVSSFQCLFTIPVFTYGKERTTKNLSEILSRTLFSTRAFTSQKMPLKIVKGHEF